MKVLLHNEIDTAHLIHELNTISEHHSSSSLNFVALEDIPPPVFAVLALELQRLENVLLLLGDFLVVGSAIKDFAEDLERVVVATVGIEPSRGFGNAENKDDNKL